MLGDGAHVYVYLQRTADGRIAIGGRGVPYRYGSRTDGTRRDRAAATVASLRAKLARCSRRAADVAIDHAWSGVLGVPRDWCMSVDADPRSGLAWAGGYVGEGVAAANLAGRTLRDLMLGAASELTTLPWVGRSPRRWEPEPLRWAAIHAVYALYRARRPRASGAAGALAARRASSTPPRAASEARRRLHAPATLRASRAHPPTEETTMAYETLLYDTDGAIATITLNRPERLNTIVPPMPEELEAAVHRAIARRRA